MLIDSCWQWQAILANNVETYLHTIKVIIVKFSYMLNI